MRFRNRAIASVTFMAAQVEKFVTPEQALRYQDSKAMKAKPKSRTKERIQEFIMVDNVNSYQANVQTEGPQDFNDKQGFNIISGVELIFAKLQNNLAAENRDYARSVIDEIKAKQADQKELSDLVAALRSAIDGKTNYDDKVIIDADLADKINEWASSGKFFISSGEVIKASVDSCILSLQNIQEIIAADVHRDMCCVQDFLHKVSSYSQSAISAISKPGDTPAPVSGG